MAKKEESFLDGVLANFLRRITNTMSTFAAIDKGYAAISNNDLIHKDCKNAGAPESDCKDSSSLG